MLNVAIDGPGGAGKSTVAKLCAVKKGLHYVDSGALYRAIGYCLDGQGVNIEDAAAVAAGLDELSLRIFYAEDGQHVEVNGTDVSPFIRTVEVGAMASKVSVHGPVRDKANAIIRQTAENYPVIMDGRDIGTVVLPDAPLKIYITASSEERARRRLLELEKAGKPHGTLEDVQREIEERDYRDMHREIAPLKQAEDAILLDTTHLSLDEVVEKVCSMIDEVKK